MSEPTMRFAGIHEGNILTEHEEHRKLALVVEVADEIWANARSRSTLMAMFGSRTHPP